MPIRVLPPAVAAKIAAGEVVDRPASAVKELVENALDAGATEIAVEIAGGGIRLIRVRDNGSGMTPDEVPLAFQRHATSKIVHAEDLLQVTTLGFRGEALPSIAAVAEVTLLTRPASALGGFFLHLQGDRLLGQSQRGAPAGTQVTVRDLFSEFPARRKFLRSPATESAHCTTILRRYALARPGVRFSLIADGKRVLQTTGAGDLLEAADAVLGASAAETLLYIELSGEEARSQGSESFISIAGLVSSPGVTRASRGYISLFVNGRWVQHRALAFAVEEAYQGSLMTGRHPVAIVHITLPQAEVDVNVHPRKIEVRFRQEQEVFVAVQRTIRRTLIASAPLALSQHPESTRLTQRKNDTEHLAAFQRELTSSAIMPPREEATHLREPVPQTRKLPLLRVLGQLRNTYIIAEAPDGMYLVDQHAAHERVVFERVKERLEQLDVEQQGLLEPKVADVSADELALLLEERGRLERYGFVLEPFGERHILVRALPAGVRETDLAVIIAEIVTGLLTQGEKQDALAASIACHSAVRAGDILALEEMRALLRDLEECSLPHTCPHGRPTMVHLSAVQLEKEFGRRG